MLLVLAGPGPGVGRSPGSDKVQGGPSSRTPPIVGGLGDHGHRRHTDHPQPGPQGDHQTTRSQVEPALEKTWMSSYRSAPFEHGQF